MPEARAFRPLLFVAMPYGVRREPNGTREVDFDALYRECIEPAAGDADVEVIRADEEAMGGIVHKTMYERLVLSELVIADLTFANANVFYELGVRHAARPHATILIAAQTGNLPFDIHPVRVIPYAVDDRGALAPDERARLRSVLADRLLRALKEAVADSPPFQLLERYPGVELSHEATDAFRARARHAGELSVRIHHLSRARGESALAGMREVEREVRAMPGPEEQLLVELLLGYRDLSAWDDMVRLAGEMPERLAQAVLVRQQLALALNRRKPPDRRRALALLREVEEQEGASAETLGIVGRCHKDRWDELRRRGHPGASAALDDAIEAYGRGFDAEPLDFYPAINLLTLLRARDRTEDRARFEQVSMFVLFDLNRLGPRARDDYWTIATELEYAALVDDEDRGWRALARISAGDAVGWMRASTARNLRLVADANQAAGRPTAWVERAIGELGGDDSAVRDAG